MTVVKGRRIVVISNEPDPPLSGTKVLFHGDSITADAGASSHDNAYYMVFQALTGYQARTMAQYGRTVQEGVQSWNVNNSLENVIFNPTPNQAQYNPVFPFDPDYRKIVFRLGVNDALQKPGSQTNSTTFKLKYKMCLQRFRDLGWYRNRIALANIGSYLGSNQEVIQAVADYNATIADICFEMGFQLINLNIVDAENDRETLYVDDVHPNDAGHLLHGQTFAQDLIL